MVVGLLHQSELQKFAFDIQNITVGLQYWMHIPQNKYSILAACFPVLLSLEGLCNCSYTP